MHGSTNVKNNYQVLTEIEPQFCGPQKVFLHYVSCMLGDGNS